MNLDKFDAAKGPELRQLCEEQNLPIKTKAQLAKLLTLSDIIDDSPPTHYDNIKMALLKELCKDRELPSSIGSLDVLRKLLKLNATVTQLTQHTGQHGAALQRAIETTDAAAAVS